MESVKIARDAGGWTVEVADVGSTRAGSLNEVVLAATEMIRTVRELAPTDGVGIAWEYQDPFMKDALAVASTRAQLTRLEREVASDTVDQVRKLTGKGLTTRDIGTTLGITAARVSQVVQSSSIQFGDSGSLDDEMKLIKISTGEGFVAGHVFGSLPSEIEYLGEKYRPTGGSHSIGSGPWKHTYTKVVSQQDRKE